jgi:hypothetical protein
MYPFHSFNGSVAVGLQYMRDSVIPANVHEFEGDR